MAQPEEKGLLLKLNFPFCYHKCSHCPLHVCSYDAKVIRAHALAMVEEIRAAAGEEQGRTVTAVALQGGSPGLTPPELLQELLRTVKQRFTLASDVQISVETMPGEYSRSLIQHLRDAGVNFWTVGFQTANRAEHELLSRPYRFDALTMVDAAVRNFDLRALNFELLYGIPGQTMHSWQHTLDAALAYAPEHLTLTPLRLLPGTPLFERCAGGEVQPCGLEEAAQLYRAAADRLEALGYRRYTVDAFALPGQEDRFRLGVLAGQDQLGFGYQASSCLDDLCYTNGHDLREYLENPADLSVIADQVSTLTAGAAAVKYVIARLSQDLGLSLPELSARFGAAAEALTADILPALVSQGSLEQRPDGLHLTDLGIAGGVLYHLG